MLKLVLRGIRANLGRLFMTLISVLLGVAFVSGSFILADSLRAIFNGISEDAFAGVDAQVRAVEPELNSGQNLIRFDEAILADIQDLPSVRYAEAGIFAFELVYSVKEDGEINRPLGPPVFTSSWGGESPVSSFTIIEGTAPVGRQVALDKAQVEQGDFKLNDQVTMALPSGELEDFALSAVIDFGDGGTGGAFFILLDLPTTQDVLDADGVVDSIVINAENDVSSEALLSEVGALLPADIEVVTGETVVGEQQESFGTIIDIFGYILLGFAGVVLFVSTFIIRNTFSILVGQRTKQLGLLRSIGASAGQIRRMVLYEALAIGLLASGIGLVAGIGVAWALKWLFGQGGGGFPDGPTQILPRTIVVVVLVGLVVTVGSAMVPAFRAAKVSPLEAILDGGKKGRSNRFRALAGSGVLIPGLILLFTGMFASIDSTTTKLTAIGLGAALTFIGVAMLSGLFAGMVTYKIGAPIESLTGITGRLGRDNAARNPERTAATASALMIGLALITGVSVLASSLLRTFDELLEDSLTADLFIFEQNQGLPFSPVVVDQLDSLPDTDLVGGYASVEVAINDNAENAYAYNSEVGDRVVNFAITEGTANLSPNGIAIWDEEAAERGLALGDSVTIRLEDGFETELTVEAIYEDKSILDANFLITRDLMAGHLNVDAVDFVGVTYAAGADPVAARTAVDEILKAYPQLSSQDNTEFQEQVKSQIDSLQLLVNGLLAMCLISAFFGIVNTMALSVLERTREIGLLRAVGMTRKQLKQTIRWEAIIVSLFGSLLGVGMGLLLGWAGVVAIPDSFISKVGIPWFQLVIFLIGGGVLGIIAAFFPASRAAKMDVLQAIATE